MILTRMQAFPLLESSLQLIKVLIKRARKIKNPKSCGPTFGV